MVASSSFAARELATAAEGTRRATALRPELRPTKPGLAADLLGNSCAAFFWRRAKIVGC
jgi:hypothetical protein